MKSTKKPSLVIYGRGRKVAGHAGLLKMSEVSFSTDPSTLRAVAKFLVEAAQAKEKSGDTWGHQHLQDEWKGFQDDFADVIVA